jgi:uncharacterized protein (DUF2225 family)
MSTTQELVERLRAMATYEDAGEYHLAAKRLRAAASRLSEMEAANTKLRAACLTAALTFRFYEQSHREKKTEDGDAKAHRNHEMAEICEKALGLQ